jgi:hypothetical protein
MRFARLCLLASFAVVGLANASLGQVSVRGTILGQGAFDAMEDPTGAKQGEHLICIPQACAGSDSGTINDALGLSLGGVASYGAASSNVGAEAHAKVGDLGLRINVGVFAARDKSWAEGGVQALEASWQDTEVFITPSQPIGKVLIEHSSLLLNGDILAGAAGQGSGAGSFRIFDIGGFPGLPPAPYGGTDWGNFLVDPSNGVDEVNEIPLLIRLTRRVINGELETIGYRMVLEGGGNTDNDGFDVPSKRAGSFNVAADVSGSLHWGGIESVTDEFGNLITDWTVTSGSGFDYSQPFGVPEPSCLLLVASALFARLAVRRGRRRKRVYNG